ncbi:hypothetical protein [Corynebacterium anserum]|uniref:Uncharacterized protein n=1 Tax=Corynebacterium anserum TaxID=2684406 RepID=A0A7G7YP82_9CORY|nr:hypothetical protein [Corynebacterium anserum]QNH96302.1 hypothetical protein GP473_06165 [Corynebacterium anserum]
MGFYEDIAEALDAEGIESRIVDGTLFVPIAPEVEVQFSEIVGEGPVSAIKAANVFVAMADVTDEDEEFEAALVGVVFSVDAAVAEVNKHIAMDQVISVLNDLIEGSDDRLEDLDFEQDPTEPLVVHAQVGEESHLVVELEADGEQPEGRVTFVTYGDDFEELLEQATDELFEYEEDIREAERQGVFDDMVADIGDLTREILELGTFTDFSLMFDALAVAAQQAYDWEEMLVPLDDAYDEGAHDGNVYDEGVYDDEEDTADTDEDGESYRDVDDGESAH